MNNKNQSSLMERFWNSEQGIKYFVAIIIGMIIISMILTLAIILKPNYSEPPIEYSSNIYYPQKELYCPGEYLTFNVDITINSAPSIIFIIETFWNVDKQMTEIFADHEQWTIVTEQSRVKRQSNIRIPKLSPGNYEYRRAGALYFSTPEVFVVPFRIRETCP